MLGHKTLRGSRNVVNLSNANENSVKTYKNDVFDINQCTDEFYHSPFGHCSEYHNEETGTYYLRARYYDPKRGRFTQEDTLGLGAYSQSPSALMAMQIGNLYAYCVNNPVRYCDPSGHKVDLSPLVKQTMMDPTSGTGYTDGVAAEMAAEERAIAEAAALEKAAEEAEAAAAAAMQAAAEEMAEAIKETVETAIEYVMNDDEQAVIDAEYFAFYKGVPVFKPAFMGTSGFSFGAILLGPGADEIQQVQHEYGHTVHLSQIGPFSYLSNAAIPSLACYWAGVENQTYYSLPWEKTADELGGVNRVYANGQPYVYWEYADELAELYWHLSFLP